MTDIHEEFEAALEKVEDYLHISGEHGPEVLSMSNDAAIVTVSGPERHDPPAGYEPPPVPTNADEEALLEAAFGEPDAAGVYAAHLKGVSE